MLPRTVHFVTPLLIFQASVSATRVFSGLLLMSPTVIYFNYITIWLQSPLATILYKKHHEGDY